MFCIGDPALSVLTVHVRMDKMSTRFHGQRVKQTQMCKLFVRGHELYELYFKWKYISCLHRACFQRSSEGTRNPGNQEKKWWNCRELLYFSLNHDRDQTVLFLIQSFWEHATQSASGKYSQHLTWPHFVIIQPSSKTDLFFISPHNEKVGKNSFKLQFC